MISTALLFGWDTNLTVNVTTKQNKTVSFKQTHLSCVQSVLRFGLAVQGVQSSLEVCKPAACVLLMGIKFSQLKRKIYLHKEVVQNGSMESVLQQEGGELFGLFRPAHVYAPLLILLAFMYCSDTSDQSVPNIHL